MRAGVLLMLLAARVASAACDADEKHVLWGDLHVHSGYSLDAWGFGTASSPAQAFAFARGEPITIADGSEVRLDRPLDFMAVTDHAEWFGLMHLCTDPQTVDHPYCETLTTKNNPAQGSEVFGGYVIPTITKAKPVPPDICLDGTHDCRAARMAQWQRVQAQANAANEPCEFTSFIGFEWSATPDFSHNHRNVIFASDAVTPDVIDYLRYPTPLALWRALDEGCRAEAGCEALAIPHNSNMGDGKSFDVEIETADVLSLRARYERLIEIHQEKGNSECLPAFGQTDEDCGFEPYRTKTSRPASMADFTAEEWARMRSGYVRRLLLRGLRARRDEVNPLELGIIGSTDGHAGTGGFVDEASWPGTVFGVGSFERAMARRAFNPGGLVGVWAESNTRASIFAALKRREVFATSGPRIRVRLAASGNALSCEDQRDDALTPMGGTLTGEAALWLRIEAEADVTPIVRIEVIQGWLEDGQLREVVTPVWERIEGARSACIAWQEPARGGDTFRAGGSAAFRYVRVLEAPTPRWSAYRCRRADRCDEFPGADTWIQERAWTSPIWSYGES